MISQKLNFKVIPLYKEFLNFLENKDFERIKRDYFEKYENYFKNFCKRWEFLKKEEIYERIKRAKISHYSNVYDFDKNFYPYLNEYLKEIDKKAIIDVEGKIIFYIGFFCPDGKTIYDKEILIGISIDRINDIRNLPIIIAHEIGHAQRRKVFPYKKEDFEEIFFSEGIAFYFSHLCFPYIKIYRNLFIKRGEYSYLMKNFKETLRNLKEIEGELLNLLSFYYIKFLVENLKIPFKEIISMENMPLSLDGFLSILH